MATRRFLMGAVLAAMAGGVGATSATAQYAVESPATADAVPERLPPVPSPTETLTAPAVGVNPGTPYPPGTVVSPWVGGNPAGGANCCGPVGAHGPMTYEFYMNTGPNLPVSGGQFIGALKTGWVVGGGGRTLLFNPAMDRAWVLDLGLSYTRNDGRRARVFDVFTPSPQTDPNTGQPTAPDALNPFFVRGLSRTSFNFALGHDWFLNGPGAVGLSCDPLFRFGAEVGGRWGTAHVDLVPVADTTNYMRKHDVYHGVFLGAHADYEIPMGATILFGGLRAQWGYTWLDVIPPQDGDIMDVNLLATFGVRY